MEKHYLSQVDIKKGTIWRVGDGKDIQVWGDFWLPTPNTYSVQSPWINLTVNTMVSDLIDRGTKGWNNTIILENFSVDGAVVIQNIPLSPLLPRDKLIWRCSSNGLFSVRSAYHLAVERQADSCGGASR